MFVIHKGDVSDNGQIRIVDEDRLCYVIESNSKGARGIRTISKQLLLEYVNYLRIHKDASPSETRNALAGGSDIDKFEYGYTSSLCTMAKMILDRVSVNGSSKLDYGTIAKSLQQIYYGAPGTGKSYEIKKQTEGKRVIRTTFHPDSDYSTFVGAYKPTAVEVPLMTVIGTKAVPVENEDGSPRTETKIEYEFVAQSFLQAYIKAWKLYAKAEEGKKVEIIYLIIEEINRGNCAQIFGDLFQLLDRGENGFSEYPIVADKDLQKHLEKAFTDMPYLNAPALGGMSAEEVAVKIRKGEILLLPNNLYIWATMNTSDQSLFPIDSAFKRRWDWRYVPITDGKKGWQIEANGMRYDWWQFLQKMNDKVGSTTNSEDKKLGYYFCKARNGVIDAETFVGKVIFYVWNDVFKDFADEAGDLFRDEDGTLLSFNKFYEVGEDGKTKVVEDKVTLFLNNLNLFPLNQDSEDTDSVIDGINDSRFSLNGVRMNLREIAKNVVVNYAQNNPSMSAQEIRDFFVNLCKGIGASHIVETDSDYHLRDNQPSQKRSVSEITIFNGEKLYVTTQWRAKNIDDNFMKFMSIVNNNGLGVIS